MSKLSVDISTCDSSLLIPDDAMANAVDAAEIDAPRWAGAWQEPLRNHTIEVVGEVCDRLCKTWTGLLVLGVGGSALGTRAVQAALAPGSNMTVLDAIDPASVERAMMAHAASAVAVVSKSGTTLETLALLGAVRERLSPDASRVVAITGETGTLHEAALAKQWSLLPIPTDIGGRFSALTPAGLFPAAFCGVDIAALLEGAADMHAACTGVRGNPAADLASLLVASMKNGRRTQILMPYHAMLKPLAEWWVQLWGESLGKIDDNGSRVGPTAIAALGTADQHSQLQLWHDGPPDKVIGMVSIAAHADPMPLPEDWAGNEGGGSLADVLDAERAATTESLLSADQQVYTITMPAIDEQSIGAFIALWQGATAIAGHLLRVDAFNQPGVEDGKRRARAVLWHNA